jgi:hypothetical protein
MKSPIPDSLFPVKKITTGKPTPLTTDLLKSLPGCEHYSDQDAEEILSSIQKLASLLLESQKEEKENIHHIDNQLIVSLIPDQHPNNIKQLNSLITSKSHAA